MTYINSIFTSSPQLSRHILASLSIDSLRILLKNSFVRIFFLFDAEHEEKYFDEHF